MQANWDKIVTVIQYMKPFNCVQKKSSDSFKNVIYKICSQIIYIIYMYKEDLA